MKYISTRGKSEKLTFEEVLLKGLAPDGGLYLPDITDEEYKKLVDIKALKNLSYSDLAFKVMQPFVKGSENISDEDLKKLCYDTYQNFNHKAVAPLKLLDTNLFGMELFHGPTLAFKDYALQLVGRLFDHVLKKRGENLTIVGATSGDTGSAAIYSVMGSKNAKIFMLHPYGKVSEVQRKQMTSVVADNVFNLAVDGNFDDCQAIVKALFNDHAFNEKMNLGAVNSINFARILAQVVYYFYAGLLVGGDMEEVSFSVPTGNFGNVLAGFIAMKMGLKVKTLIIASNPNDILPRFISSGKMEKKEVKASLSPSMDIQISSNFERLLFLALDKNSEKLCQMMEDFNKKGSYEVDKKTYENITNVFKAVALSDEGTLESIKKTYEETGEILDPHSAIAVFAARDEAKYTKTIAVLTAHGAKFEGAVKKAINKSPIFPSFLENIMKGEEKCERISNDAEMVKNYILKATK
ncbi:MAG: Threonine synthase [Alphaproteobacteria bacterium ADurb.Bin438]|nr:MAG: Threonine synthase [Alphaproteobacteria bacterium ADurb.Bin438]